jgi:hypothetical protein
LRHECDGSKCCHEWRGKYRCAVGISGRGLHFLLSHRREARIPIHNFHGASARFTPDETAFANRRPHFVVEIVAGWEAGDSARHRAWADGVSAALATHTLSGGYANLLGSDDHDQIANAHGENDTRLGATKKHYNPDGVFTAIPLPSSPVMQAPGAGTYARRDCG